MALTDDDHFAVSVDEVGRPSGPAAFDPPLPYQLHGEPAVTDESGDLVVIRYSNDANRLWVVPDISQSGSEVPIDYAPGTIGGFVISPDGQRVLVAGTEGVRVYSVADGRLLDQPFEGYRIATDEDRSVFAVGLLDGTVVLGDATTMEPLGRTIAAPPGSGVALSPDGSMLKVLDANRRLQFYDVATQAPLGPPVGLGSGSDSDILPDSRSMLLQRDGSIVQMSLDPDAWLDQACLAAGRNLTIEE